MSWKAAGTALEAMTAFATGKVSMREFSALKRSSLNTNRFLSVNVVALIRMRGSPLPISPKVLCVTDFQHQLEKSSAILNS
jgi:hypothetical protein